MAMAYQHGAAWRRASSVTRKYISAQNAARARQYHQNDNGNGNISEQHLAKMAWRRQHQAK